MDCDRVGYRYHAFAAGAVRRLIARQIHKWVVELAGESLRGLFFVVGEE